MASFSLRALLHFQRHKQHQIDAMSALARGLERHGIYSVLAEYAAPADFIVWWGDHVPSELRDIPRLILEAGYINGCSGDYVRDRLRFVSTGWNGLHGRADPGPPECPSDRFEALDIEIQPWRTFGEYALICDQHPSDYCSPKTPAWQEAQKRIKESNKRCLYRAHPLCSASSEPLRHALRDAHSCFTWNSTAAIEAVLYGVPTVALDRGSMAWEVTSHDIDGQFLGERKQWAYNLAYRQWTLDELSSGLAWEHLQHGIETKRCA